VSPMPHDFKPQSAKDKHFSRDLKSFKKKDRCGSPKLYFPQCILQYTLRSSFFYLFLYALGSNTVDGWKWLEMGSVLSQREMIMRFHQSG
jgi:hypothetical protein